MKLQGKINGNCVTLEVKKCESNNQEKRLPKNYFDKTKNFITTRYETEQDIYEFFSSDIFRSMIRGGKLKVAIRKNKVAIIQYKNTIYYYAFTTGRWFVETEKIIEPVSGYYYTSSIRSLVWDYILRDDADIIKSSFAAKKRMISYLESL